MNGHDRHFAYGGSTIVVVFPKELIKYAVLSSNLNSMLIAWVRFDGDLVSNSEKPIETLVKVGDILPGA